MGDCGPAERRWISSVLKRFERVLILILLGMMAAVLGLATLELGYILVKDILSPPVLLLGVEELLDIFGLFMLVLIGIELLETVKTYLREDIIHVEIVFTVALIAVARKVIILDIKELPSVTLLGIGFIILALSAGYFLIKRTR